MNDLNLAINSDLSTRPFPGSVIAEPNDPDYELARAAATGATSALADLYHRHSKNVYSLCLRMTRNATEAEDLTQDVFMQLLRKISSFRGQSRFSTWLYRLTVNQVLMHYRRASTRRELTPSEIQLEQGILARVDRAAARKLVNRMALNAALARLPSGYRTVFLLFEVNGYKHDEIARIYGCSVGNSKSQLHKARRKLRSLIGGPLQFTHSE
jgi:RNA polymerase sigma-70 factor (ECF subfamily)